jgi:hypothetical protein
LETAGGFGGLASSGGGMAMGYARAAGIGALGGPGLRRGAVGAQGLLM